MSSTPFEGVAQRESTKAPYCRGERDTLSSGKRIQTEPRTAGNRRPENGWSILELD